MTYLSNTTPRRESRGESLRKFFWGVLELPQEGVAPKMGVTDDILGSHHRANDPPVDPCRHLYEEQ